MDYGSHACISLIISLKFKNLKIYITVQQYTAD